MRCRLAILAAAGVMAASPAAAQACAGATSFEQSAVHIGVVSRADDSSRTFGGDLTVGSKSGPFVGTMLAGQTVDGLDGPGVIVGGLVGVELSIEHGHRLFMCPTAAVVYQSGPDSSNQRSMKALSGGGAVGFVAYETKRGMRTILTTGISAHHQTSTASYHGLSNSRTEEYALLSIGAGFVFRHVYAGPAVRIRMGVGDGEPFYGIVLGFAF